ncbi:unnamed protein product [Discula destructiva]
MASAKVNGAKEPAPLNRADEASELIDAVKALIIPFIQTADTAASHRADGSSPRPTSNALIAAPTPLSPTALTSLFSPLLPTTTGSGTAGVLSTISHLLNHSVNTWDQGFLDKLYASPTPVGLAAELLLATLNTNLHVFSVSPALTVLEKLTASRLAAFFGLTGPHAGGVTCAGGSASNLTSLITARSHLHPATKAHGNGARRFVVFTSAHGHYSVDKAALIAGFGTDDGVVQVPVDAAGCMDVGALRALVARVRGEGRTPLYVNATAGTTVLGSYDPLREIAAVCRAERMWMHVDASWGGSVVFSAEQRSKLAGVELADSVTVNPHKMLGVNVTCSFLLGPDMRVFHAANRTDAPYLFHGVEDGQEGAGEEVWDLADLTLQCGRRGDAIKLALAWVHYGPAGFAQQLGRAFEMAALLTREIRKREGFVLVGAKDETSPPPCLQVCFYYRYSDEDGGKANTTRTAKMVGLLKGRGFMVDYASFPKDFSGGKMDGGAWRGSFFRVVVNVQTRKETVLGLVEALEEVGREIDGVASN